MTKQRDHLLVLSAARLTIRKKAPFFAASAYALTPIEVPEVPTSFITPGLVMGYNPEFISKCTDDEAAFVMLHELLHDRLRFFPMLDVLGKDMQHTLNDAQDMVINQMLRDMGFPVFDWALMPKKFGFPEGLSTPEYVELLLQKGNGKSGPGKDSAEGSQGSGGARGTSGVCGGQCRAPTKELEKKLDAEAGRTEIEVRAVERQTAMEIKKHLDKQNGRGSVPGWMEEWAKSVLEKESLLDWKTILNHLVLDVAGRLMAGGDDTSFRRPSKRSYAQRLVRPGPVEHEVQPLFCLDTSGSMNVDMMLAGVRESVAILRQLGCEMCWYMEVDARVTLEPRLVDLSFFEKEMKFTGRGGTDFRPAFAAIEQMPEKPDIVFYWTDGDGCAPELPPPNVEVIWGLVPGRYSNRKPARWGHLVVIDDDPKKQKFFEDANVADD